MLVGVFVLIFASRRFAVVLVEDGRQRFHAFLVFCGCADADSEPFGQAVGAHGTDDDAFFEQGLVGFLAVADAEENEVGEGGNVGQALRLAKFLEFFPFSAVVVRDFPACAKSFREASAAVCARALTLKGWRIFSRALMSVSVPSA